MDETHRYNVWWKKSDAKSTYCIVPFLWSAELDTANLCWYKAHLCWCGILSTWPSFQTFLCTRMCVCVCSVSELGLTLRLPWTTTHQAPQFMGFSRQEYWRKVPFPPPGDLSNPGVKPVCPVSLALTAGFSTTEPPGKPLFCI